MRGSRCDGCENLNRSLSMAGVRSSRRLEYGSDPGTKHFVGLVAEMDLWFVVRWVLDTGLVAVWRFWCRLG